MVWVDIEAGCGVGGGCRGGGKRCARVSNARFSFLWSNHFSMGVGGRGGGAPLQRDPHLASPGSPQHGGNHEPA